MHFSLSSISCHQIKSGTWELHISFVSSQFINSCFEKTHWNNGDNDETFGGQKFFSLASGRTVFHESPCLSTFVCWFLTTSYVSPQYLCKHWCWVWVSPFCLRVGMEAERITNGGEQSCLSEMQWSSRLAHCFGLTANGIAKLPSYRLQGIRSEISAHRKQWVENWDQTRDYSSQRKQEIGIYKFLSISPYLCRLICSDSSLVYYLKG